MNRNYHTLFILFLLLPFFFTACGRSSQHQEAVASVNDAPVFLEEFQKEISLLSKRDPDFKITPQTLEGQLSTIIDKKLLLQEARNKGLTEDERFIETIKAFWEQTLIRGLVELKTREWGDKLFVTEDEIQKHYQRMQYMPVMKLAKVKDKGLAEEIKKKMMKGVKFDGEETIGPLFIEDVKSEALFKAFDMNIGEVNIYEDNGDYFVAHVVKREKISTPPLKAVYSRIKTFLLEQKRQTAMEEWLREVKGSAKININTQLLKEIDREPHSQ